MKKGFLVTFEGGDGAGKTTQVRKLTEYFKLHGISFVASREPGGTGVGGRIREILLYSTEELSSEVEFLLFSAARAAHVENVIKPALDNGHVVILDRYYDSSYAYQGYAGKLDISDIENVTNFAIQGAVPDLTFVLDISYSEAMKRKGSEELDRIEGKGKVYHDKVRKGYLELAEKFPDRIVVVDASKDPEKVFEEVIEIFKEKYEKR